MTEAVLVAFAIGVVAAAFYVGRIYVLYKKSQELDKKIDFSKMKAWKDDEE